MILRPAPLLLAASLLALPPSASGRGRARRRPVALTIPLLIRVAVCGGKPVRSAAWVKQHLSAAAAVLAPHGVRIAARQEPFTPERCALLTRTHRHALAAHAQDDRVTVLVVQRARDLDVPSYDLMGVHWRYKGPDAALAGRRWILLTARARPPVLAHELCHYFGLPHDPAGGNLMTPGPSAPIWKDPARPKPSPFSPVLTGAQARRLRRELQRWSAARAARGSR